MNITKIAVAFALLLITGCTHDREQPLEQRATLSLKVASGSSATTNLEDQMDHVRIVAFEAASNPSEGNVTTNSGKRALEVGVEIAQSLTVGLRDICIFTNEDIVTDLTTKLNGLSNFRDLEAIQIPYTPNLAPPFLFSLVREGMDVKAAGNEKLNAQVVRTVSKVVLNLKQTWGVAPEKEVVIERVQVKGLPEYSYLIGRDYDGNEFVNSEVVAGLGNQSIETNTYQKTFTFYIPEFLGATAEEDKHAYIEIQGYIKENPSITCTYRCPLGDGMAAAQMTNYNITRNTQFTINGTIKGYGQTNQLEIEAIVQDWNTVNSLPEDLGEFLKVPSSVAIEYGEDLFFDIQASDLASVTATHTNTKVTLTKTNGFIKLRSDDMTTTVKTPKYDEITVTMGGLTKVITVAYRPHPGFLMAKYNLTGNSTGIILAGPSYRDYGAYFKYGSVLPIKGYPAVSKGDQYDISDVLWTPPSVAKPMSWTTIPIQYRVMMDHTKAEVAFGRGDPCRLLGLTAAEINAGKIDNAQWRLPTIKELGRLVGVSYWRAHVEPAPLPQVLPESVRYRYSDTFDLWFPFAGCRGEDATGVVNPGLLHNWGLWQANTMGVKNVATWYDGISSNCLGGYPHNGQLPFVNNGGSPTDKAHSVRCIQQ